MEIDTKLDMSLDDLIAKSAGKKYGEKEKKRQPKSAGQASRGGRGQRSGGDQNQRGRQQGDSDVARMDEDEKPRRGRKSDTPSGTMGVSRGGIAKKGRGSTGRGDRSVRHQAVEAVQHITPPGNIEGKWSHDLHMDSGPARPRQLRRDDVRTKPQGLHQTQVLRKLIISNLHADVDEDDLQELFGKFGTLEFAEITVLGDRRNDRKGTAEVLFQKESSARDAKAKYDGVALDGESMKIDIRGVADVERVLKSGLRVTRPSGTGPRGRGAQGRLRSD